MALVIADAGPVIALTKTGQLALLQSLFGEVTLPEAVWQETQAKDAPDSRMIQQARQAGWLRVEPVVVSRRFPLSLHDGECQALQLAYDKENALLILDDQFARREAIRMKLNFIGTVKVLAVAEQQGLIDSAEAAVLALQTAGYRVSVKFLDDLL
ncbi:MAG: DUF3368 domain-containing protein [Thiolinea sp.]